MLGFPWIQADDILSFALTYDLLYLEVFLHLAKAPSPGEHLAHSLFLQAHKVQEDECYDGKFVLQTNSSLPAADVALHYKELLLVEQFFRAGQVLAR